METISEKINHGGDSQAINPLLGNHMDFSVGVGSLKPSYWPKEIQVRVDSLLFERVVKRLYPSFYLKDSKVRADIVEGLRECVKRGIDSHNKAIDFLAKELLGYIQFVKQKQWCPGISTPFDLDFTQALEAEIQLRIKTQTTNYRWFFNALLSFLGSVSAKDSNIGKLYSSRGYSTERYLETESWRIGKDALAEQDLHTIGISTNWTEFKNVTNYCLKGYLNSVEEIQGAVIDYLANLDGAPRGQLYPIFSQQKGIIGCATLFKNYNRCNFTIGVPYVSSTVHGVLDSSLEFAVHDIQHATEHSDKNILSTWAVNLALSIFNKTKGDIAQISRVCVDFVVSYYNVMTDLTEQIYYRVLSTSLIKYNNPVLLQKCLIGLHLMMHEAHLPESAYAAQSLESYFDHLFEHTFDFIKKLTIKVDDKSSVKEDYLMTDILKTSPLDGSTLLSDEEIARICAQSDDLSIVDCTSPVCYEGDRAIEKFEVKRYSWIYDVEIQFKNKSTGTYQINTLACAWVDLDDYITLIHCSGVDFKKPELDPHNVQRSREICAETVVNVYRELSSIVKNTQMLIHEIISNQTTDESDFEHTFSEYFLNKRNELNVDFSKRIQMLANN